MYVEQIYTGCLSQAGYYIESDGEAAIIDPMREPDAYIKLAESRNAKIKYVFETHFHADFISGHLDLANKTGADIVFGPMAEPAFPAHIAYHCERFSLGKCTLQLLHTPGHTIESSCILLKDENGKDKVVFTGDTLFVGDVGRPDLLSGNKTSEELASMLYDSLNNVIKNIPDYVMIYPGHGSGSACGKNLGIERYSSVGIQKKTNYALQELSREEFINTVTADLIIPPAYFFKDAAINKGVCKSIDEVTHENFKGLSIDKFHDEINNDALVLDTRDANVFARGHIKGSLNIGLNGDFAPWVGRLIDMNRRLILVSDLGTKAEVIIRLARIGYENVGGYLLGGLSSWTNAGFPIETVYCIDAEDFYFLNDNIDYISIDVRSYSESKNESVLRAINIPLEELQKHIEEFSKEKNYVIFCKSGYRSMIAASILQSAGILNIISVTGGIKKIKISSPDLVIGK